MCENTWLLSLGEALLVAVNFTINCQKMRWQFPYNFVGQNEIKRGFLANSSWLNGCSW